MEFCGRDGVCSCPGPCCPGRPVLLILLKPGEGFETIRRIVVGGEVEGETGEAADEGFGGEVTPLLRNKTLCVSFLSENFNDLFQFNCFARSEGNSWSPSPSPVSPLDEESLSEESFFD